MSTKIHSMGGIPALPAFVIYGRRGVPPVYFGRTLYSPRHHIDAQGRPIPVRVGMNEKRRIVFVPSKRPATVHALDKPAPAAPVRKTATRFKFVATANAQMRPR